MDDAWNLKWFVELMELIGVQREDIVCPKETVFINNLLVPEASFQINGYYTSSFINFTNWIGGKVSLTEVADDTPVFLTKKDLKSGVVNYANEDEFCYFLEKEGFQIVAPEGLSLKQQISLFRSGRSMSGMLGSNMHTSIFSHAPHGVALNIGPHISESFYLLDEANSANFRYVTSWGLSEIERQEGFRRTFSISDPRGLAVHFAAAVLENTEKSRGRIDEHIHRVPEKIEYFFIRGKINNNQICVRVSDGSIFTTKGSRELDDGYAYPLVAARVGESNKIALYALSAQPFSISDVKTNLRSWFIPALLYVDNNSIEVTHSILSPSTNLYFTVPPYDHDIECFFQAAEIHDWEVLTIEKLTGADSSLARQAFENLLCRTDLAGHSVLEKIC